MSQRGFPLAAVIISAVILLALGTLLLNLAVSGSLPTGLGLGAGLPDLVRGLIISLILLVIAVIAYRTLRKTT